jgi:protein ImuA
MSAATPLLSRRPHRAGPVLDLGAGARLPLARLHEGCGLARRTFALLVAARLAAAGDKAGDKTGPLWWISPAWEADQLHAEGVAPFFPPERLLFVRPKRAEDVLWTLEEILRSGTAGLAVADIPGLPGLTAVRRLHLAAETGAEMGARAPLGLILTPGPGGAQGVESRWRMEGDHGPGRTAWRLDRLRARMDPPRSWQVDAELGLRKAGEEELAG